MKAEWEGQHPTEGTIHSWIDGELDSTDAERLDAHLAECAACQSRVAEARGLVAAASRVIGSLDQHQAPIARTAHALVQPAVTPVATGNGTAWRFLRVTPTRAAIAAVLIVAAGITLTREYVAVEQTPASDSVARGAMSRATASTAAPPRAPSTTAQRPPEPKLATVPSATNTPVTVAEAGHDSVLRSAIARRLETDQPARTIEPAQGTGVPSAPVSVGNVDRMDTTSARQMFAARSAVRSATAAMGASVTDRASAKTAAQGPADVGCYRIDPSEPVPRRWDGIPLPSEVALVGTPGASDVSGTPRYGITPLAGGNLIGVWSRPAGDTLFIVLNGSTVTTSGALVASGSAITGVLRSAARADAAEAHPPAAVRVAVHRISCRP